VSLFLAGVFARDLPVFLTSSREIDNVTPHERAVSDKEGRWHLLRIRPYKTVDNRPTGAVLAMVNIDGTRRFNSHLQQSRAAFQTIFETVRQPMRLLDAELRVKLANQSFLARFELIPHDLVGRHVTELEVDHWPASEVRGMLQHALKGEPQRRHPPGTSRGAGANGEITRAHPMSLDDGKPGVLLTIDGGDGVTA